MPDDVIVDELAPVKSFPYTPPEGYDEVSQGKFYGRTPAPTFAGTRTYERSPDSEWYWQQGYVESEGSTGEGQVVESGWYPWHDPGQPSGSFGPGGHVLPTYTIATKEYKLEEPYQEGDIDRWAYIPGGEGVSARELARVGIAPSTGMYGQEQYRARQELATFPGGVTNPLFQSFLPGRSGKEAVDLIMRERESLPTKTVEDELHYDLTQIAGNPNLLEKYGALVDPTFPIMANYIQDGNLLVEDAIADEIPFDILSKYGVTEDIYEKALAKVKAAGKLTTTGVPSTMGRILIGSPDEIDKTTGIKNSIVVEDEQPIFASNKTKRRDIFSGIIRVM